MPSSPSSDPPRSRALDPVAVLVFALVLAGFVAFPAPGSRGWDAWMTASVMQHWPEVPAKAIFFFAHPLVLPITRLFSLALPIHDQLFVGMIRESTCAAGSAVLLYLLLRALWRGRAAAAFVALAWALCFSHWRLATSGEEKDVMTFFSLLALLPWFHLRGDVRFAALDRLGRDRVAILVGAALGLATAVHLQNGLLVVAVGLSTVARRGFFTDLRRELRALLLLAGGAAVVGFGFFLPVGALAAGARSPDDYVRWLGEYHLTGQFVSTDYEWPERVLKILDILREYVVGDTGAGHDRRIGIGLAVALLLVAWRALRAHRGLAAACLIFAGITTVHCFNFQQEPEQWVGGSVAFFVLFALATSGRGHPPGLAATGAWAIACALLLANDAAWFRREAPQARTLAAENAEHYPAEHGPLARRFQALVPEAQVALRVDAAIEPDAILIVEDRLLASAFHVYTDRRPLVAAYIDRDDAWFDKPGVNLTVLSRHFYTPVPDAKTIKARGAAGTPVYDLFDDKKPDFRVTRLLSSSGDLALLIGLESYRLYRM